MAEAVKNADLVVEAATENIDLKIKIFQQLDQLCPEHTILASNTSSISITRIGSYTKRPGKVIGMHFMNPVPVMKLVEIINGYATEHAVTNTVYALSQYLGKVPCIVNDYPGFISNRILMAMINEAQDQMDAAVGFSVSPARIPVAAIAAAAATRNTRMTTRRKAPTSFILDQH